MAMNESLIRTTQRRLRRTLILRSLFAYLTPALFAFGSIALILRLTESPLTWLFILALASCPLAVFWVVRKVGKDTPGPESIRAWFDHRHQLGGLLMTEQERDTTPWAKQYADLPPPTITWRAGTALRKSGLAAGYLALVLLIPASWLQNVKIKEPSLDVSQEVAMLQAKLDEIEQLELMDPELNTQRAQELQDIRDRASGFDPAQTWEALDNLNHILDQQTADATEELAKALEEANALEQLAQALEQTMPVTDSATAEDAVSDLNDLVAQAAGENPNLQEALQQSLQNEAASGQSLSDLQDALSKTRESLNDRLAKTNQSRVLNPEQMNRPGQGQDQGKGQAQQDLKEYLESRKVSQSALAEMVRKGKGMGSGGRTRGPGAAPLNFDGETSEHGARFEEVVLSGSVDPNQFVNMGISAAAPQVGQPGSATFNALSSDAKGNAGAYSHQILPRHRGAVSRYFENKKQP